MDFYKFIIRKTFNLNKNYKQVIKNILLFTLPYFTFETFRVIFVNFPKAENS